MSVARKQRRKNYSEINVVRIASTAKTSGDDDDGKNYFENRNEKKGNEYCTTLISFSLAFCRLPLPLQPSSLLLVVIVRESGIASLLLCHILIKFVVYTKNFSANLRTYIGCVSFCHTHTHTASKAVSTCLDTFNAPRRYKIMRTVSWVCAQTKCVFYECMRWQRGGGTAVHYTSVSLAHAVQMAATHHSVANTLRERERDEAGDFILFTFRYLSLRHKWQFYGNHTLCSERFSFDYSHTFVVCRRFFLASLRVCFFN